MKWVAPEERNRQFKANQSQVRSCLQRMMMESREVYEGNVKKKSREGRRRRDVSWDALFKKSLENFISFLDLFLAFFFFRQFSSSLRSLLHHLKSVCIDCKIRPSGQVNVFEVKRERERIKDGVSRRGGGDGFGEFSFAASNNNNNTSSPKNQRQVNSPLLSLPHRFSLNPFFSLHCQKERRQPSSS